MKEHVKEICNILAEFDIKSGYDYLNKIPEELSEIYENMKIVHEKFDLSDDKMEAVLESILGEFDNRF